MGWQNQELTSIWQNSIASWAFMYNVAISASIADAMTCLMTLARTCTGLLNCVCARLPTQWYPPARLQALGATR